MIKPAFTHFPITVIDEFLDDPQYVLDVYRSLKFNEDPLKRYPGKRTENLAECAPYVHHMVCKKLFSLWYKKDMHDRAFTYAVHSFFQESFVYHENPLHIANSGWQHTDGREYIGAGVIYLTPNAYADSGTSFYELKKIDPLLFEEKYKQYDTVKLEWYRNSGKISLEEYVKVKQESEELYEKTLEVKNKFNRLVCFGSQFHKENGFYGNGSNPRVTLLFFIQDLEALESPNMRLLRGI